MKARFSTDANRGASRVRLRSTLNRAFGAQCFQRISVTRVSCTWTADLLSQEVMHVFFLDCVIGIPLSVTSTTGHKPKRNRLLSVFFFSVILNNSSEKYWLLSCNLQNQVIQHENDELRSRELLAVCDNISYIPFTSSVPFSPDDTGVYPEIPGEYMPLTILTRSWEVSREKITIQKVIGKGAFGKVAKAIATDIYGTPGPSTVAVKMLKGTSEYVFII